MRTLVRLELRFGSIMTNSPLEDLYGAHAEEENEMTAGEMELVRWLQDNALMGIAIIRCRCNVQVLEDSECLCLFMVACGGLEH